MVLTFAALLILLMFVFRPLQKNAFFMVYFALMLLSAYCAQKFGLSYRPFSKQSFLLFVPFHLVFINFATFAAYGADKKAAQKGTRRTPEAELHLLEFLGGTPAAYLAQKIFHHKTKKKSFQMLFLFVLALQVAIVYYMFRFLNFF